MDLPSLSTLQTTLLDASAPIAQRNRAVFYLRSYKSLPAAAILEQGISASSALLKHEICYALGQMGLEVSIPFLTAVLRNPVQEAIVRHEAGEALGAIGNQAARTVLEEFETSEIRELAETCHIALKRLDWVRSGETVRASTLTLAVDPAPAFPNDLPLSQLSQIYNDPNEDIFTRYRALFSLRDTCTPESIEILAQGLLQPHFSPLFKHEIAFVLGELSEKAEAVANYLEETVRNTANLGMVRHEASEALSEVKQSAETALFLKEFLNDPEDVVRESCEVGLDIMAYWKTPTET